MEGTNLLNSDNATVLYVFRSAFSPIINKGFLEFKEESNSHSLLAERNYSPKQLHALNIHLLQLQSLGARAAITAEEINSPIVCSVEVQPPAFVLNFSGQDGLESLLSSNAYLSEMRRFKLASEYVTECFFSRQTYQ